MNINGVPILGQTAVTIPAQFRLDASDMVGRALENLKRLGLRFGRLGVPSSIEQVSAQALLVLEALEAADCRIVSVNEHIIPTQSGGAAIMMHILYRAPEALFTTVKG